MVITENCDCNHAPSGGAFLAGYSADNDFRTVGISDQKC
jgi:hypothetical protein